MVFDHEGEHNVSALVLSKHAEQSSGAGHTCFWNRDAELHLDSARISAVVVLRRECQRDCYTLNGIDVMCRVDFSFKLRDWIAALKSFGALTWSNLTRWFCVSNSNVSDGGTRVDACQSPRELCNRNSFTRGVELGGGQKKSTL